MTTLNLDLDVAEKTLLQMETSYNNFTDSMDALRHQVYTELRDCGEWKGVSAYECYQGFEEISREFSSVICKNWVDLRKILSDEITQWREKGDNLLDVH